MSILVGRDTRVVVQGITGRDGSFHARGMKEYGTQVVAGVSPLRAGTAVHGIPVFGSVREAVQRARANTAVIYVPAPYAPDAIYEAADAGVRLIVCITEGIPVRDMVRVWAYLADTGARDGGITPRLIGPNCPGLISPGLAKVGIMPGPIHKPGRVGLVSRSGTLTYEVVDQLTRAGLGQSTCIGIGGDPVIGTTFVDALELFEADRGTDAVVMIGEIGGTDEETAARFIKKHMKKPVVAFIAGRAAPPGKRMGHAGAIISGGTGTAAEKVRALQAAGVAVAEIPSQIPELVRTALARRSRRATGTPAKRSRGGTNSSVKRSRRTTSARGTRAAAKPKRARKASPARRAKAARTTRTTRKAKTARPTARRRTRR